MSSVYYISMRMCLDQLKQTVDNKSTGTSITEVYYNAWQCNLSFIVIDKSNYKIRRH